MICVDQTIPVRTLFGHEELFSGYVVAFDLPKKLRIYALAFEEMLVCFCFYVWIEREKKIEG